MLHALGLLHDRVLAHDFRRLYLIITAQKASLSGLTEPIMGALRLQWWADQIMVASPHMPDPDLGFLHQFMLQRNVDPETMALLFKSLDPVQPPTSFKVLGLYVAMILSCLKLAPDDDLIRAYDHIETSSPQPFTKYDQSQVRHSHHIKNDALRALWIPIDLSHKNRSSQPLNPLQDLNLRFQVWVRFVLG